MMCYCITCEQEKEMIITNEIIDNKRKEKRINGYCKVCCEKMCLIIFQL